MSNAMQLRLPIDLDPPEAKCPVTDDLLVGRSLVGSWCGGERLVTRNNQLEPAHVWFHFLDNGRVSVSVRYPGERQPVVATGAWRLDGQVLSITVGSRQVRAEVTLIEGVVRWAGEVLVRMPEGLEHPFPPFAF